MPATNVGNFECGLSLCIGTDEKKFLCSKSYISTLVTIIYMHEM